MKELSLSNSELKILIDDCDYEWASIIKWRLAKTPTSIAVVRSAFRRNVPISKDITGCNRYDVVDHRDHNPLNNQRDNLRICSKQENCFNRSKSKNTNCKYKGIYPKRNKFAAQIKHNGTMFYLGSFNTQEEAAKAYNIKAKELFGEFAALNEL